MKKILVLVVVALMTAISLYAQSPCQELDFDDCYPMSLRGKICYFFHEFRERHIKYDEEKLKRNIEYDQTSLNYSIEGYVELDVHINKKGKISKIKNFNYPNNLIKNMALKAIYKVKFRPAKKDWKNITDSVHLHFKIALPYKPYNFEFLGKKHNMEMDTSFYPYYHFVNLQKGIGEKVNYYDNVILECTTYNSMQEFIQKDTLTINSRNSTTALPIEDAIYDMQIGGEKLLLLEKYLLSKGVCSLCEDINKCEKVLLKIKVLDIIPNINK